MAEKTPIHPYKVGAHLATDCRLGYAEHDIILDIGVRPERVATLGFLHRRRMRRVPDCLPPARGYPIG